MKLDPRACEFYRLEIETSPPVASSDWELTVDGSTWHPSQVVDGLPAWLVKGEDYTGSESAILVARTVAPSLRLIDNPETIVRRAPVISIRPY